MQNPRPNTSKLLSRARTMRREPSEAERRLWQTIRNRQVDGLKFRRQLPIGSYIVDFACEECRLIVEVDGKQHDAAGEYDEKRTHFLNHAGWRVIRIYAGDVLAHTEQVLFHIAEQAKPSP